MMEPGTLPSMYEILGSFGIVGLIVVLWWFDSRQAKKERDEHKKEIGEVLLRYRDDMQEIRHMYESNVSLVQDYRSIAGDLKDVVVLNTQAMTRLSDDIRQNEFCPMQRVRKRKVIKGG